MLLPSVAVNNFPLPVSSGLFYLPASSTMSEGLDGLVMSYSTLDIASETNGKSANENQLVGKITAMEGLSVDEVVALIFGFLKHKYTKYAYSSVHNMERCRKDKEDSRPKI